MPFTPAHPAIILPFLRARYVSATALVIGTMAPDFEYFFKLSVDGQHGHTPAGVFYFDLPVVVGLAFLFHLVVKQNLIQNLPLFFRARFQDTLQLDFVAYFRKHWALFALSALLGTATHLLWDSFTHNDGYFAERLSIYKDTVVPYEGVNYPLFYALQNISTFVGLTLVIIYCVMKRPMPAATHTMSLLYWLVILVVMAITTWLRFAYIPYNRLLGNIVVTAIGGFCLGLVICGLIRFPHSRRMAQKHG